MKTVSGTDYTNHTTPMHFGWKKCLSSTPTKIEKIFIKYAQNEQVHIFNVGTIIMQSLKMKK